MKSTLDGIFQHIFILNKDWGLENNTNLNQIFCLIKSSEIAFIFKLKLCLLKLLVICHVLLLLTFENSNPIKLLQIGSNCIKLIIWLKQDILGSNWIKMDQT